MEVIGHHEAENSGVVVVVAAAADVVVVVVVGSKHIPSRVCVREREREGES